MRIKQIGTNKTVLYIDDATVLFSYGTPVAALIWGRGYVRTNKFWSVTTSKHINQWLANEGRIARNVEKVDQSVLNDLIK